MKDVIEWSKNLSWGREFDLIVGVERSGIIPATILALHWNKPFLTLNQYFAGNWEEYIDSKVSFGNIKKVLIVDDSISSGRTAEKILYRSREVSVYNRGHSICFGGVYITPSHDPSGIYKYFFKVIPLPRMFEWNFIHNNNLRNALLDIDGVIYEEPPLEDDTEAYEKYIENPIPLYIPTIPVLGFVSGRLEKYREVTERSLKRYGIEYGSLQLAQFDTIQERRKNDMGAIKGNIYKESQANVFFESSKQQAKTIRQVSGKDVICIEEF
jgi:hypothetical protein